MSTTLLVEPDDALSLRWAGALRDVGHDVICTRELGSASKQVTGLGRGSVRVTLDHVREGGVDVVVVDAVGGHAAVTALVDALGRLPDAPPLVLLSGFPDGPELSARIGASGFLPMPCDTDEILREVGRITGGQVRSSQAALVIPPLAFDDEPTGEGARLP